MWWYVWGHLLFEVEWWEANGQKVDDLKSCEVINKFKPVILWNAVCIVVSLWQKFLVAQRGSHRTASR